MRSLKEWCLLRRVNNWVSETESISKDSLISSIAALSLAYAAELRN